jgi:hypothetical protein
MEKKINLIEFFQIFSKSTNNTFDYNQGSLSFTNDAKISLSVDNKKKLVSTLISYLSLPDILSLKLVNKQMNELIDDESMKTYLRGKEIQNLGNLNSIWDRFSNMKQ